MNKNLGIGLLVLGAFLLILFGVGAGMMSYGMHGYGMGGFGLFGLLFWIIILVGAYLFLTESKGKDNSLRILRERYAKGEISKKDFERMKKDLS